jgi:hypothetical protein
LTIEGEIRMSLRCRGDEVVGMVVAARDESGTDIIRLNRPTERFRHSYGKIVFESGHLISVTIRTALVSGNSKLDFYDPNMINITIR